MTDDIGDVSLDVTVDASSVEPAIVAESEKAGVKGGKQLSKSLGAALRDSIIKSLTPALEMMKADIAKEAAGISNNSLYEPKLSVKALTTDARLTVEKFVLLASHKAIDISAKVSTEGARVKIDEFIVSQKTKAIELSVKISKQSLAFAGGQIATLTGLSGLGASVSKFSGDFATFFGNLPAAATKVFQFANIGSILLTVLGSLAVSINLLASAGPGLGAAFLALPGLFAALGASLFVFKAAMANVPASIKAVTGNMKQLKKEIATDFWSTATTGVKALLQDGFKPFLTIAAPLGSFVGGFAESLDKILVKSGALQTMLTETKKAFSNLTGGTDVFANIITNLGLFSSSLLPGISAWIVKVAGQFNEWLGVSLASGKLYSDLTQLGAVLHIVWDGFMGLLGIIKGIGTAASSAGIGNMLTPLQGISDIVNSPAFQKALSTLFNGAAVGAGFLMDALVPLGHMIAVLAPTISSFLSGAGGVLSGLISNLAKALSQPIFQKGLSAFFDGILSFIRPLVPLMPIFAEKLALIGKFAGNLLTVLGPVFAQMLATIVPVLSKLFTAFTPLINILGPILVNVVKMLGPVLGAVIDAATPLLNFIGSLLTALMPLITVLIGSLTPVFKLLIPIFNALIPPILSIVQVLVAVLTPIIGPLVQLIVLLATVALKPFSQVLSVVAGVLQFVSPLLQALGIIIGAVVQTLVDLITGNTKDLGKVWSDAWAAITDAVKPFTDITIPIIINVFNFLKDTFSNVSNFLRDAVKNIGNAFSNGFNQIASFLSFVWKTITTGVTTSWNRIIAFFTGIPGAIKTVFDGAVGWLTDIGKNIINGLINGIRGAFGGIRDFFSGAIGGLITFIKGLLGIHSPSTVFASIGQNMGAGLVKGLASMQDAVQKQLADMVSIPTPSISVPGTGASSPNGSNGSIGSTYGYSSSTSSSTNTTNVDLGGVHVGNSGSDLGTGIAAANAIAEKLETL